MLLKIIDVERLQFPTFYVHVYVPSSTHVVHAHNHVHHYHFSLEEKKKNCCIFKSPNNPAQVASASCSHALAHTPTFLQREKKSNEKNSS